MSSVSQPVEQYFPFDTGLGANASQVNWRKMARLFYGTGVVPGFLNQLATSTLNSIITVQTGAVWIDGFYGENDSVKQLSSFGLGPGQVVARMDPTNHIITLNYVPGQSVPHQDINGFYEVPIFQVTAASAGNDIRQFCRAEPEKVAKGRAWRIAPYLTSTAWHNYGFDTTDGSTCWLSNKYQFRAPYAADYFATTQVGFFATAAQEYYNAQIVRTNASNGTVDIICHNDSNTNAQASGVYTVRVADIIPCKVGDLLTVQHYCKVNGAQGLTGKEWAYFSVRALS